MTSEPTAAVGTTRDDRGRGPRRTLRVLLSGVLLLGVTVGSCARREEAVMVFAAVSLADVLVEIADTFEATPEGGPVEFNFAGSNELARQILAGGPADLFLSADRLQAERLWSSGIVAADDCHGLLSNTLVVVARRGSTPLAGPLDLLAFDRLAMADPAAVPAGVYARRWLEASGLWERLAPRTVATVDVRAALAAVAAGDLPVGIVYQTDAASSDRVSVVYRVLEPEAPPIEYHLCRLVRDPPVERFAELLASAEGQRSFEAYGFRSMSREARR